MWCMEEDPDLRLVGMNGTTFELTITGLEDPGADWLNIHGHVVTPALTWDFHDACLEIAEAVQLGRWLHTLAGPTGVPRLEFLEPVLTFAGGRHEAERSLTIGLDFEAHPRWKPITALTFNRAFPRTFRVRVKTTSDGVREAADTWLRAVGRFKH
jgi:hypothetical protein